MSDDHATASAIIRLMQGVVYRDSDEDTWLTLDRLGAGVTHLQRQPAPGVAA